MQPGPGGLRLRAHLQVAVHGPWKVALQQGQERLASAAGWQPPADVAVEPLGAVAIQLQVQQGEVGAGGGRQRAATLKGAGSGRGGHGAGVIALGQQRAAVQAERELLIYRVHVLAAGNHDRSVGILDRASERAAGQPDGRPHPVAPGQRPRDRCRILFQERVSKP